MFVIADNLQITRHRVEQAVRDRNPEPIRELAVQCQESGAQAIDVNTGPLARQGEEIMRFLVEAIQDACDLSVCLDTVNPLAMESGLRAARNRPIINGFSLQPAKLENILPLARDYEADLIGFLLQPDGHVPRDADTRLALAVELVGHLEAVGVSQDRLVIDPVAVPLMWDDGGRQAVEVVETVRLLPEVLGYDVRTMVGLSNLTSGKPPGPHRQLMEQTYLAMLGGAGLNWVLLNIFNPQTVATAQAVGVLGSGGIFSWQQ
ncbi:MAG: dihydropteroate synthase [Desulfatibacillum sp.]|nr:dihydropteroate synthase [Desulfatibacillum sp.]